MYEKLVNIVWFITTIGCGTICFYGSNGAFWPTFGGVVVGCVLGMILGFWLLIILALAEVAEVIFLILSLLR
jgi:hypothetical protein